MNQYSTNATGPETSLFYNPHERELLISNFRYERLKTVQSICYIGVVLLVSNIIVFARAGLLAIDTLWSMLLVPAVMFGVGFFAKLQPTIAAIGAVVILIGLNVYTYLLVGSYSLTVGMLYKILYLYFLVKAVHHAKETGKAKNKLEEMGYESSEGSML